MVSSETVCILSLTGESWIHLSSTVFMYCRCCQTPQNNNSIYLFYKLISDIGRFMFCCFTSCWFWLTSSISYLTSLPLNFTPTPCDWKPCLLLVPRDDISVVFCIFQKTPSVCLCLADRPWKQGRGREKGGGVHLSVHVRQRTTMATSFLRSGFGSLWLLR